MEGGNNGPAIVNGGVNSYDRPLCFDAPVAMDTGLYVYPTKTLLALREELMTRLGFAAMLASPPPGMTQLLNSFLQDAQEQLYMRPGAAPMRTERWWAWQTTAGRRIYDVPIDCTKALDFRKITGAWLSDNGGRAVTVWNYNQSFVVGQFVEPTVPTGLQYECTTAGTGGPVGVDGNPEEPNWPLVAGEGVNLGGGTGAILYARAPAAETWSPLHQQINPLEFSSYNQGMPLFFELREYLEVWPIPDKTYVIWLKGHLGLKNFDEDADECTIDSRLIFLMALANAKAHYGQPDGGNYFRQLEVMLGRLVASSHGVKRYIPDPRAMKGDYITWGDRPIAQPRATFR